jgi:hypothetical protein
MTLQILESGVMFGDFEQDDVFEIEKSPAVARLGDGICKVEFICNQNQAKRIVFLEAKSSYPRKADDFFKEIKAKMLHSLTIWVASVTGRHPDIKDGIGVNLQRTTALKKPIHFILVIPDMPSEHCGVASDKFRQYMSVERRLWNIKDRDIRVLNRQKAEQIGLVSSDRD